ncbi:MAG: hypothetical protein PHZ21_01110 [Candidatus Bipolaricaulis sp.]|nr:hypothetical protein [Candidatus Bipolaricaulis sp.]MDY0391918.1 hypothetical protein [Candidatus Bipolaricaulis sp.]
MKEVLPMRRLGIALVCAAAVTVPSMAQLSGSWEMSLVLLPANSLEKAVLTLAYSTSGWSVSSVSTFNNSGYAEQEFRLRGSLGFLGVTGAMAFNPSDTGPVDVVFRPGCDPQTKSFTLSSPEYMWGWIKPELSFSGIVFSALIEHWLYPYIPRYAEEAKLDCDTGLADEVCWPCCESSSYMRYTLTASVDLIAFIGRFEDCCTGIMFKDFSITLTDVSLCCGVAYDAELYFTKAGFQYVEFVGKNLLGLCCGFSLDVSLKFTVDGKQVGITPKWHGLGEACVEVFGDVIFNDHVFQGVEVYGYRLSCTLAECNTIEFLSALDPEKVEELIGDVFEDGEYESIRFGICGLGCCGGRYYVKVDVYFSESGSLFGISRAKVRTEIPLLANLIFVGSFSLPVAGDPSLSVGMVFSF